MMKDKRDDKEKNWCEWMNYTETHPYDTVHGFTIKDFMELRDHIQTCMKCNQKADKILNETPPKNYHKHLEN